MRAHRTLLGAVFGMLCAAGCHKSERPKINEEVELQALGNCADLEAYIKEQATHEMNDWIEYYIRMSTSQSTRGLAAAVTTGAPVARPEASEFTTTNTQERGVDEADFVKNDGSRIFVLHDRQLLGLAAWPAASTALEFAHPIEGYPTEMFLDRDRIAVFSRVSLKRAFAKAGLAWPPSAFESGGNGTSAQASFCLSCPAYADGLKVTVLDVSGREPVVLAEHYAQGSYLSSRRIGSSVRLVTTAPLRGPQLRYWPSDGTSRLSFERLRLKNLALIQASTLGDWLPHAVSNDGSGAFRGLAQSCSDFYATTAPARLGLTTVSTFDLDRPALPVSHSSILNATDHVYASRDALYVTAYHYWYSWEGQDGSDDFTYLHKFDIRDPVRARYAASGGVRGHILDQFSMGESGGLLRVATTGASWRSGRSDQANSVFVLANQGGRLRSVGELRGLAPGERIYSARFLDDRGYLVTFKKVDPLFTIDFRNPSQPRVAGELKVPGFSTYIHPLDSDHLLTIGREAADTGGDFALFQALNLQVFGVSDPAAPRLVHKQIFGSRSSSSTALYDYKAFNFFAARGLLAIPFYDYPSSRLGARPLSTLELFRVTLRDGIAPLGSIDHADLAQPARYSGYPWGYSPEVRRSVMMEDYVYSISLGGLKVNHVQSPTSATVTIPFPEPLPWNVPW
jgi:hypothetical protein